MRHASQSPSAGQSHTNHEGPASRPGEKVPHTIYYDGTCPLCTLEIGHYAARSMNGRLAFVDISATDTATGADLRADAAMRRFHVRLPDGSLVSGARAFVTVWSQLQGWRWAAKVARLPGVTPLLEGAYRLFLPLRPLMARLAARLGARPERHERRHTA